MVNWKGPWVQMRDGGCKCCGQSGEGEIGTVSFSPLDRGRDCRPGCISQARWWDIGQLGFKKSFLALSFLSQFSGLSDLVSQSEGLYFKTELGLLLIFLVLWEPCRRHYISSWCLKWKETQMKFWLIHFKLIFRLTPFAGRTWMMSLSEEASVS